MMKSTLTLYSVTLASFISIAHGNHELQNVELESSADDVVSETESRSRWLSLIDGLDDVRHDATDYVSQLYEAILSNFDENSSKNSFTTVNQDMKDANEEKAPKIVSNDPNGIDDALKELKQAAKESVSEMIDTNNRPLLSIITPEIPTPASNPSDFESGLQPRPQPTTANQDMKDANEEIAPKIEGNVPNIIDDTLKEIKQAAKEAVSEMINTNNRPLLSIITPEIPTPTSSPSDFESGLQPRPQRQDDKFYMEIDCIHTDKNSTEYSCQSTNFTELELDECQVNVTFTYTIVNKRNKKIRLNKLINESFEDILKPKQNPIIRGKNKVSIVVHDSIDVCENTKVERQAVAMSAYAGENGKSLPILRESINFQTPTLPFYLDFDVVTCEVDDGSGTSCAKSISKEECIVDIKLNYTFTNVGLSCAQIMSVKAEIGSLGTEVLSFDDIYSFSERQICAGEYWTIPDRRTSINLCKEQENPWDIVLDVDEFFGTTTNLTYNYEWREYLSNIPSSTLSAYPSAAPSKDTCRDCTLTGVVSGASRLKLWGNGKEIRSFQGVCDVIAIDNPYLQLQIRTRPGRSQLVWSGTVQVALLWKATETILFRFVGNDRMTIDNIDSHKDVIQYTFRENPRLAGKFIHKFQFTIVSNDNFIQIEELPYGLHNIEVKGFGATFGGSSGFVGSWDRWSDKPRVVMRDGKLYSGFDASRIARSWKVIENESILEDPSDVCANQVDCGPDKDVLCVEDLNNFRFSEADECTTSCDDIADPTMRVFCELDVKETPYAFWACQNSYTAPIINESIPPSCPLNCVGDATTEKFFIEAVGGRRDCFWAIRDPAKTAQRCGFKEVAENCCNSCCASCQGDAIGDGTFLIPELDNITKDCAWAGDQEGDPRTRCAIITVLKNCCSTCAAAVPSESPSITPTNAPIPLESSFPTEVESIPPSFFESGEPSQSPTYLPTKHPSQHPSEQPTGMHSDSPSQYPSPSPTRRPTKYPTKFPIKSPTMTPSISPSLKPSQLPSSSPSDYPSCNNGDLEDKQITFALINICWRIQFYEGGSIWADLTDTDCSSIVFTNSASFSHYGAMDSGDRVHFAESIPGQGLFGVIEVPGWSGIVEVKEDSTLNNVEVGFPLWDNREYLFRIIIYVPSCESLPDRDDVFGIDD